MSSRTGPEPRQVVLMSAAVTVAAFGLFVHNVREFGLSAAFASQNGEVFVLAIWMGLLLVWCRRETARKEAAWALFGWSALNLFAGAVLTALPVGFLPFEPEQSAAHYGSHVAYGVAQLPLVGISLREGLSG